MVLAHTQKQMASSEIKITLNMPNIILKHYKIINKVSKIISFKNKT